MGFEPCLLGFSLVIALSTSTSLFVSASASQPVGFGWVSNLVRVAAFLAVALLSHRLGPLSSRRGLLNLTVASATLGAALVAFSTWAGGDARTVAYVVGLVTLGTGYALLYLFWIELYARMDLLHVVVCFALVHLASAAVSLVLAQVGAHWLVACCIAGMPALSGWLYRLSLARVEDAPYMQGETTATGWTFPVGPVVLLATFTLANNFVRHYLTVDLKGAVLVGVMLAAVLVLALVVWRAEQFDLGVLYALCLPLIVAGALCVLVPLAGFGTAGGLLTNAAYTLFSVFVTALLCNISYRYGVDAPWLFGFSCAAINLGSFGASALAQVADAYAANPATSTLAVSAVVLAFVCLYAAFANRDVLVGSWGITRTDAPEAADPEGPKAFDERCARTARLQGLTKREEEVLLLLVRDMSFSQIEESLSISNSTLKTHARHIYAKFGVSGRHELAELLGAPTPGPAGEGSAARRS